MTERRDGLIYFAAPVGGGRIKIGQSMRPIERVIQLMSWSPIDLEILATTPGDYKAELFIHWVYREHYVRHEWFEPVPEILALVAYVQTTGVLPEHAIRTHGTPYKDFSYRKRLPKWTEDSKARLSKSLREYHARREAA